MSSSDWLDRLWSSKGFSSTNPRLDLDPFIASLSRTGSNISTAHPISPQNPPPPPPPPPPLPINAQKTSNIQPSNAFTRITNALSDLFCVGDPIPKSSSSSSFPTARKSPRKQPNPMHYLVTKSSDDSDIITDSHGGDQIVSRKNVTVSSMMTVSVDYSGLNESTVHGDHVKLVENFKCDQEEEDADKGCPTLDGFSRTEVTVIDTSFAGWKFEKFLFRKDVTWKACDKKGSKATVALGKKKKKKKKRKALAMAKEKNEGKKLKVLHQGSSMLKKGSSGCNEVSSSILGQ